MADHRAKHRKLNIVNEMRKAEQGKATVYAAYRFSGKSELYSVKLGQQPRFVGRR